MRRRIPLLLMALALLWPASPARASTRIATDGDPTHPVWYHDTTAVRIGGSLDLAWNDDHAGVDVRSWSVASSTWTAPETRLSSTWLNCGCTDSTHTNPHRHDVPALFTDPAGR